MSKICIINLKNNNLDFDQLNVLIKRLMKVALKTNTAVFAHSFDYGENIIKAEAMKNFFLISDSFLYKNCDLLDTSFIVEIGDKKKSWKQFNKRFNFFRKYLNTIFSFKVSSVEIIISDVNDLDYSDNEIQVKKDEFIIKLFELIYQNAELYSFGFPSVKFKII